MKNPAKLKFSNSYLAKLRRIKNLPKEATGMFLSTVHRDALTTMKNFKEGIKKRSFGLKKLSDGTIKRKQQIGMERPETPLYGLGDEKEKNSYINMLRIKKIKDGYMVSPSASKHYSRKIDLYRLWRVHELGTTIKVGKGIIRIPSRPALLMAFRKTISDRNMRRDAKIMKKAIQRYAQTGNKKEFSGVEKSFMRGLMKYEIRN